MKRIEKEVVIEGRKVQVLFIEREKRGKSRVHVFVVKDRGRVVTLVLEPLLDFLQVDVLAGEAAVAVRPGHDVSTQVFEGEGAGLGEGVVGQRADPGADARSDRTGRGKRVRTGRSAADPR